MMRKIYCRAGLLLLCVGLGVEAFAKATIAKQTIEGQPAVVMANELVNAVFLPGRGGECSDFVYKPTGKRLVMPMVGSLVGNRVWNYANKDLYMQWQKAAWDYEVEERPGEVALVMRAKGKVDFTQSTELTKKIVLRDGEAMLRVTHTFSVGQELMNPQKIGLWFYNMTGVTGERNLYSFPLDEGVVTLDSGASSGEMWFYNPSRGWVSLLGESGTGLCFNMEYRRLMCFYMSPGKQPTFEWAFRTMEIKNGESFTTEELLIPFHGIKSVHGSAGGVVAGFEATDKITLADGNKGLPVVAQLTSGMPLEGELNVVLRPLPDGADVPVHQVKVSLKPGEVQTVNCTAKPPREGTWLLVGAMSRNGQEIMDFIKPVTVGAVGSPVRIPPKEERAGLKTERFQDRVPVAGTAPKDIPYSAEIETPHVKWAKPYAGGKLKVLVLTSCIAGREAAELAQRLDMELIWVTAGVQSELNYMGYLFCTPTLNKAEYLPEHMNGYIKKALAQPCDAVIIGGLNAGIFSREVLELISKKVSEGMGLVYVAPNHGTNEVYSLLPVKKVKRLRTKCAKWSSPGNHFITTGIPFDVLPQTDYAIYEAKGEVLAKIAEAPLLVAQEGPGKGRVVVFAYNTGWQGSGNYSCGMTPWVEETDCEFNYWEYHFSILAKALIWSARKEPVLQLKNISAQTTGQNPGITMAMENPGAVLPARAEVTLSDAYGRVESHDTREVSINPGAQSLRFPLPANFPGGLHLADVILKDKDGKVITWGSASLRTESAVQVAKIVFDKRAYYPGDTARASVDLKAAGGKPAEVVIVAEFTDAIGRLLARVEKKTNVTETVTVTLDLPVGKPLATTAMLRLTVSAAGQPVAVAETEIITFPEKFARRESADWEHRMWGPVPGAYGRKYLGLALAKRLNDFQMDTVMSASNWQNEREFEIPVRLGFQIMPMNASSGYINVGHRVPKGKMTFAEQQNNYQKTHDNKFLVRPICLNDPADLEPLAEKLRTLANYTGWLEPADYNLGDEMSTTKWVTPMDYDFAPAALAAFRDWLKTQYGKVNALNKEWDTKFTSWDEVMPMSTFEVKGRGNYAPWADHREFMDFSFSSFFTWTRERLRERDPGAKVSMSGSQAAEAYGGYDWTLLAATLGFVQNYTHQNTTVMLRSFRSDLPRAPWYGYGSMNPTLRRVMWWRLFEGNYGGSFYSLNGLFRPDLTYGPTAAEAAPIIREFKAGAAKLLKNCERVSEIGVHYSHASIRGACICGEAAIFRDNREGWVQALEDAGYQCEFLSTAQIEAGELAKRNYSAFVLPYSVALSEKEVAALRKYVEQGGLLITDGKSGLMDLHCKTLSKGALDDLLGVSRPEVNPMAPSREGHVLFSRDEALCKLKGLEFDVSAAEPNLVQAGGTALGTHGQTPMVVTRKTGKGTAVFLNMFLDSFAKRRKLKIDVPMLNLVENLLRLHGIAPTVIVASGDDTGYRSYTVRYRSGDALYVGSVGPYEGKDPNVSANVSINFPKEGFVYDLRKGTALGRTREVKTAVLAGDALLYAVMPYQVTGLNVKAGSEKANPGQPVKYSVALKTSGGDAGMHVIGVEIVDPDGKKLAHYGASLLARAGNVEGEFITALNDKPGRWTIRATDYVTRIAGECTVNLGP